MSGLEDSVRKLVREEAASAAAETVESIRGEVRETMAGIRGDLRGIASAEFKLSAERLLTWSRLSIVRPAGQSEKPAFTNSQGSLFDWRNRAIDIAFANAADKSDTKSVLADAERIARFLIDGCLDGEARPVADLVEGETGGAE